MGITFRRENGSTVVFGKFNPYHDGRGRFASANGAMSFTYAPGKSKAHDNAIERERQRQTGGNKLESIGGQGAKSVRAALDAGMKIDEDTQEKIANRINSAKIRRFEDFTDRDGVERYSFRIESYDDKGSSVAAQPKKEWYSYDVALAVAAYRTLMH